MERRSSVRYPLVLEVRYLIRAGKCSSGTGQTVNMSSGGILISSQHRMEVGTQIEASLRWPWSLDGKVPLQLVAVGRIVRSGAHFFAVNLERHHFRTMKSKGPSN